MLEGNLASGLCVEPLGIYGAGRMSPVKRYRKKAGRRRLVGAGYASIKREKA